MKENHDIILVMVLDEKKYYTPVSRRRRVNDSESSVVLHVNNRVLTLLKGTQSLIFFEKNVVLFSESGFLSGDRQVALINPGGMFQLLSSENLSQSQHLSARLNWDRNALKLNTTCFLLI